MLGLLGDGVSAGTRSIQQWGYGRLMDGSNFLGTWMDEKQESFSDALGTFDYHRVTPKHLFGKNSGFNPNQSPFIFGIPVLYHQFDDIGYRRQYTSILKGGSNIMMLRVFTFDANQTKENKRRVEGSPWYTLMFGHTGAESKTSEWGDGHKTLDYTNVEFNNIYELQSMGINIRKGQQKFLARYLAATTFLAHRLIYKDILIENISSTNTDYNAFELFLSQNAEYLANVNKTAFMLKKLIVSNMNNGYLTFYLNNEVSSFPSFSNSLGPTEEEVTRETREKLSNLVTSNAGGLFGKFSGMVNHGIGTVKDLYQLAHHHHYKNEEVGDNEMDINRTDNSTWFKTFDDPTFYSIAFWKSSSFSQSFNATIRLTTERGDNLSIMKNVLAPYMMILSMALPVHLSPHIIGDPLYVQCYVPGKYSCAIGMINNITVNTINEMGTNIDGLPLGMELTVSVSNLYNNMGMVDEFAGTAISPTWMTYLSTLLNIPPTAVYETSKTLTGKAFQNSTIARMLERVRNRVSALEQNATEHALEKYMAKIDELRTYATYNDMIDSLSSYESLQQRYEMLFTYARTHTNNRY